MPASSDRPIHRSARYQQAQTNQSMHTQAEKLMKRFPIHQSAYLPLPPLFLLHHHVMMTYTRISENLHKPWRAWKDGFHTTAASAGEGQGDLCTRMKRFVAGQSHLECVRRRRRDLWPNRIIFQRVKEHDILFNSQTTNRECFEENSKKLLCQQHFL